MGRNWPPNSFAEWMVGQNFRPQQKPTSVQTPILRIEISEDEASGDETVAVTYPRRRLRVSQQATAESSASESAPTARKVRFGGEKPLKSALKKTASPDNSDDTLVDTSETSEDASSEVDESDTSEYDAPIRRRKGKSKKPKTALCQKDTDSEDSSAAKDALPHETCDCSDCKKGRKILRAILKFNVNTEVAEKETEAKVKEEAAKKELEAKAAEEQKEKSDAETTTDATDTSQAETTDAETLEDEKKKQKGKNRKEKQKPSSKETEVKTTEADAREDDNKKQKGKNKKEREKERPSPKDIEAVTEEIVKAVNKAAFKIPKYPKEMEPNLIMPIRSKVMQVEHALEGPNDPRPNAFFDATKGIARVYHGPQYGNHMAELYGKSNSAKIPPGGPATPSQRGYPSGWGGHPAYGPWLFPGPPPGYPGPEGPQGTPFGPSMPIMNTGPPKNEDEMKVAAAKGFGLSGQAIPQTPAVIRAFKQQEQEQEKAASERASQKNGGNWNAGGGGNGWGDNNNNVNTNWGKPTSPAAAATANPDPPTDASQGQGWSGNGGDAWNSGQKQNGVASPANFAQWTNGNGNRFERQSNKSGSQKGGSQKNWGPGKPESQVAGSTHGPPANGPPNKPADGSQGGGGDQWNQSSNQNAGWDTNNQNGNSWGADNQNNNDWSQGNNEGVWGAPGANGEQGQPSNVPHYASSPPKPLVDAVNNDPQANTEANDGGGGGGGGWGQNNGNNNWGAPVGGSRNNSHPKQQDWGAPGNSSGGYPNHHHHQQQQNPWTNPASQQPWGGPPGSKPASQRHSSPGCNNMNGGRNTWQNTGAWGDNNNNNGKQQSPPQMVPGGWSNKGSRRGSPNNEKVVGAFGWPAGQQEPPPPPPNNGGSGGGGGGEGGGNPMTWNNGAQQQDAGSWGGQPDYASNQATGPSYYNNNNNNTNSWQNPDIAQHTGGAADQW